MCVHSMFRNMKQRPAGIFTWVSRLCLQGGGVFVQGGTVTLSSCTISGNTAYSVRAYLQNFPSPSWETHVLLVVCRVAVSPSGVALWPYRRAPSVGILLPMCALTLESSHRPDRKVIADVLAPTHACTTANASRSTTVCTCHRDLAISHRPHGKVADALASTHASTTVAHSPVNYRGYVRQRPETFPSPSMGTLLTRLPLLTLLHNCKRFGQLQGMVRAAETLKVPIASCDTHVLLVVCREVVSISSLAQ